MSHIYQTLFDNKDEVIKGLLKAYRTNHLERDFANETEMLSSKIDDVTERKDELLGLSVNGEIDNKKFGRRNDRLNTELEELSKAIRAVKEDELSEDFKLKEIKDLQIKLDKMWDDSVNGNGILPTTLLDK